VVTSGEDIKVRLLQFENLPTGGMKTTGLSSIPSPVVYAFFIVAWVRPKVLKVLRMILPSSLKISCNYTDKYS